MRREQEAHFAWALATAASAILTPQQHTWMCVTLGVGDYADAIESLLNLYADGATPIPADLASATVEWLAGYTGAEKEPRLRSLVERAGVAVPKHEVTSDEVPIRANGVPPNAIRPSRMDDAIAVHALQSRWHDAPDASPMACTGSRPHASAARIGLFRFRIARRSSCRT